MHLSWAARVWNATAIHRCHRSFTVSTARDAGHDQILHESACLAGLAIKVQMIMQGCLGCQTCAYASVWHGFVIEKFNLTSVSLSAQAAATFELLTSHLFCCCRILHLWGHCSFIWEAQGAERQRTTSWIDDYAIAVVADHATCLSCGIRAASEGFVRPEQSWPLLSAYFSCSCALEATSGRVPHERRAAAFL